MSYKYIQFDTGITLVPQNTNPPSSLGDIRYNSTSNKLEVYNGSIDSLITAAGTNLLILKGAVSGAVTLTVPAAISSYDFTFPDTAGNVGQVLATDGTGILSWVDQGGGGGGANSALSNLSGTAINATIKPGADLTVDLGSATKRFTTGYIDNTISSNLTLNGSTSGTVTLTAEAISSVIYQLPGTDGSSGQVLSTNGGGILSWITDAGITQLTGDVTAGPGNGSQAATVAKLQNVTVSATTPTNGQILTYNSGSTQWEAQSFSGAANTSLSNLTSPTAINQNLTFDAALSSPSILTPDSGVANTKEIRIQTGDASGGFNSGNITLETGAGTQGGDINLTLGSPTSASRITLNAGTGGLRFSSDSGGCIFTGASFNVQATDLVNSFGEIIIAAASGVSGASGRITLGGIGHGTTIRGPDTGIGGIWTWPNATGPGGYVMTSDSSGNLSFVASAANILTFTSNTSSGGMSSEVLVVTGLLSTDTILSVTQITAGSNNTATTGYNTLANNALTVTWTADPGTGATVLVTIKR